MKRMGFCCGQRVSLRPLVLATVVIKRLDGVELSPYTLFTPPYFSLLPQQRAFHPKVLYCYTKMTHHIPVDTRYMLRPNKENPSEPGITFCTKCFKEQKKGNEIFVDDVGNGER